MIWNVCELNDLVTNKTICNQNQGPCHVHLAITHISVDQVTSPKEAVEFRLLVQY